MLGSPSIDVGPPISRISDESKAAHDSKRTITTSSLFVTRRSRSLLSSRSFFAPRASSRSSLICASASSRPICARLKEASLFFNLSSIRSLMSSPLNLATMPCTSEFVLQCLGGLKPVASLFSNGDPFSRRLGEPGGWKAASSFCRLNLESARKKESP